MTAPTKYTRQQNFQNDQNANQTAPFNGAHLDSEFNAVQQSNNAIADSLAIIQRSDGQLNNGIVTMDSLSLPVVSKMASGATTTDIVSKLALSTGAAGVGFSPSGTLTKQNLQDELAEIDKLKAATSDLANASNGKGVDLIANAAKKVASIAALKALRVPQGSDAQTLIVDGAQGGNFYWNATSTAADDGGITINPTGNIGAGRWVRLLTGAVDVRWYGAKGDGITDDTAAIQAALNSGYPAIVAGGLPYVVTTLTVPANVIFDGQGGSLLTTGATNQSVINTSGDGSTVQNWKIRSNVPGTRKGMYGVNIVNNNITLRHLYIQDISYSAVMNNGTGTRGHDLYATNCGWDLLSNYTNALDGYFTKLKAVANGRSGFSTDAGAKKIVVDGIVILDNGLDAISDQHKDCIHFEGATDCVVRNAVIRYSSGYAQGTVSQTWAMLRWYNSTNCLVENVDIKAENAANNKLLLGQVDASTGNKNSICAAININVDSTSLPSYQLVFWNYDAQANFRLIGGRWEGYTSIHGNAAGFGFSTIRDLTVEGEGSGQFLISDYITSQCDFLNLAINGYGLPFNLAGFRHSSIKGCVIDGAANSVFQLLNTNAAAGYQPDGGVISGNTIRAISNPVGTILNTNNQQTTGLLFANNTIDCSCSVGLMANGGTAGATTANVKAIGNIINGTITNVTQGGTNSAGTLNANMNNVAT